LTILASDCQLTVNQDLDGMTHRARHLFCTIDRTIKKAKVMAVRTEVEPNTPYATNNVYHFENIPSVYVLQCVITRRKKLF
jgi:hypothetical protein